MKLGLIVVACAAITGCRAAAAPVARTPDSIGGSVDERTDATSVDEGAPVSLGEGPRLVVLGRRSRLVATGHSTLGNHTLGFDRWTAHIDPSTARIVVEIDLRSLRSEMSLVTSTAKHQLLDVERNPRAMLSGVIRETSPGVVVVDGVAAIHGRTQPLRFEGKVRREGEGVRFSGSFAMSRSAFGLTYAPIEPFLDDRFVVTVDAVAAPEKVNVEELD